MVKYSLPKTVINSSVYAKINWFLNFEIRESYYGERVKLYVPDETLRKRAILLNSSRTEVGEF